MGHNTVSLPSCPTYAGLPQHHAGVGLSSKALAATQKWPGGLPATVEDATKTQHGQLCFFYVLEHFQPYRQLHALQMDHIGDQSDHRGFTRAIVAESIFWFLEEESQ